MTTTKTENKIQKPWFMGNLSILNLSEKQQIS